MAGWDNFFAQDEIFSEDKNLPKTKNLKMGITHKTKKIRLGADFSLDHTGDWGGVSNTMIMIGNFRNIKGLT